MENLIYEVGGYTIGSWVYAMVLPRLTGRSYRFKNTLLMQVLMKFEHYKQLKKSLKCYEFMISEGIMQSEVIHDRISIKLADKDGYEISNITIFITEDMDKFEDIDVNTIKSYKNKLIVDEELIDRLIGFWGTNFSKIDSDLFENA